MPEEHIKGEIVARDDQRYPEGALIVDGYDEHGNLLAHPMGGGFQLTIPVDQVSRFDRVSEAEQIPIFHRAAFEIEGIDGEFMGWTDGTTWNGWEKPRFEIEEARRLIAVLGDGAGRYEQSIDSFSTRNNGDEPEVWKVEEILLPDGGRAKVYPIGAGSWIWDKCGEEVPSWD